MIIISNRIPIWQTSNTRTPIIVQCKNDWYVKTNNDLTYKYKLNNIPKLQINK